MTSHKTTGTTLAKKGYRWLSLVFTMTIFMLSSFQPYMVSAADFASEKRKLDMGITFADDVNCAAVGAATGVAVVAGAGGAGVDKTNINPKVTYEYGAGPRVKTGLPPGADITLEDWAKLVLKSLAAGYGGSAEEITSEEKVKVLVAMAIQEGGSRQNKAAYNMFNVAKDPKTQDDLNPIINNTYKDGNTHPAFKTLDEGVEAVVRFIEKGHYSRIHDLLTDPKTTGESFAAGVDNLSYNGATGQQDWAAGGYGPKLKNVLSQLEKNPERMKWTVLGDKDSPGRAALLAAGVTPADEVSPVGGPTPTASSGGEASDCSCTENKLPGDFAGGDNQEKAFNYFKSKALTAEQAAGIIGNLMQESSPEIDPAAGNSAGGGNGAHGIAQWRGERWNAVGVFAEKSNRDVNSLELQLDFLWYDMTGDPVSEGIPRDEKADDAYNAVRAATTVEDAMIGFESNYERCGCNYGERLKYANEVLAKYGGAAGGTDSRANNNKPGFFTTIFGGLMRRGKVDAQLAPTVPEGVPPPAGTDASGGQTTPGGKTVLLDPGHGGAVPEYTDEITGLKSSELNKQPETQEVWDITQKVKTDLETANYKVVLSRDDVDTGSTKRDRVKKAVDNKVDLAVSIHYDPNQTYNEFAEVWPQKVGGYRENADGSSKTTFDNEATATKSLGYANALVQSRTTSEGRPVKLSSDQSEYFNKEKQPDLGSFGDLSLVQLYSQEIPWVYNEVGTQGGEKGMTEEMKTNYAKGLTDGIKAALGGEGEKGAPLACAGANGGAGVVAGNIVQTALNLAWDHKVENGKYNEADAKPEYVAARTQYNPSSGDNRWPSDCGVFVATVMKASGADPDFPGSSTTAIKTYLQNSPKYQIFTSVASESELKPGDILIRDGHVLLYIGQPNAKAVEASLNTRGQGRVPGTRNSVVLPPTGGYIAARLVNREKL